MGGCVSTTPEERDAKQRSAAIDRQLRTDLKEFENTIKILLLGAYVAANQRPYCHCVPCVCVCVWAGGGGEQ